MPAKQTIITKTGEATYRGTKNEKLWTVFWDKGDFTGSGQGSTSTTAEMSDVHGQIFQDPKVASTFKSRHGSANSGTKTLVLTDHVVMESHDPDFVVTCDKVVYDGKRKVLNATGHVQVLGTFATVGTIDELWATPDFSQFATSAQTFQQ